MSPQAPRIGLATVTNVSFSLGGMGGTHCVLSLTQPSGKSDSSGLLRHGRGRGITSASALAAQKCRQCHVGCRIRSGIFHGWASHHRGLLARDQLQLWHHRGTASRPALKQGSCLCAAVATPLLNKTSALCWSKVASLATATTVTWPKPWEPNSFGIASVTPSSDTNVRCVQAREDSTLWLNSSCVATALMANQLWRVQDAARAKSAA